METRRPYRIVVFARGPLPGSQRHPSRARRVAEYAYMGWNPMQHFSEGRLPGDGSFLYPGIFAVRREAMKYLALPETQQVQIRTNQDRTVYLFNKHIDGRISGYRPEAL